MHEAVTGVRFDADGPPRPKPGDYTMCTYCGALLQFDNQMNERAVPPDEEVKYIATLDEVLKGMFLDHRERVRKKTDASMGQAGSKNK